ncbi:hypothetical protein BXZ70DRAFT_637422 [Cristinia sonorae]|uniref:Uncharacterized protein n=1 Tax=Cristinia sonorae TaxID=1940300 RepID=A0A8K0UE73_9AGAR|nr:hypothetical protein BXZ70DRAFT_637422 [Cristinia sonorae]
MIIRLVAPSPVNTVLFTVSFNTKLPSHLTSPPFYANQLQLIAQHDLDHPSGYHWHALDKSTWLIAALHEVVFDLTLGNNLIVVRSTFSDGDTKEWSFKSDKCMSDLLKVCQDVQWAGRQAEWERYERYGVLPPSESEVLQPKKHKKQRSLLMSLVSSLVPSSPGRHRAPSPPSSPPSTIRSAPMPPCNIPSHTFRRRARSALVDAFRRYVVGGLSQFYPSGSYGCGYIQYVVRSMLRRNEDRMAALLNEAGLGSMSIYHPQDRTLAREVSFNSPFYDDEEEAEETSLESRSTDTDGSSVHTPTDSPGCSPLLPSPPSPTSTWKIRHSRDLPRTPTPPSPVFAPTSQTLSNIHALNNTSSRLQHFLSTLSQSRIAADSEDKQALAVLEVKSRRRAWSNRDLLGRARVSDIGFGMPERSSPLGRCVVNADDVVDLTNGGAEEGWMVKKMWELNLKKTASKMSLRSASRLFPVSEEDEEDGFLNLQTTSRVALDLDDADQDLVSGSGYVEPYGSAYGAEDFDGMTPSVRLVEDAENGLLMPLPLQMHCSPTPPTSPTSTTQTFLQASLTSPPPRRERKRSMINRSGLPILDGEVGMRPDPDLPSPSPSPSPPSAPSSPPLTPFNSSHPHQHTPPYYHHGHPLSRYRFDPQTKIEIFDASFDDDLESAFPPHPHHHHHHPAIAEEEFTLAMDVLPHPPTHSHHRGLGLGLPLPVTTACSSGGKKFRSEREEWVVDAATGLEVGVEVGVRLR